MDGLRFAPLIMSAETLAAVTRGASWCIAAAALAEDGRLPWQKQYMKKATTGCRSWRGGSGNEEMVSNRCATEVNLERD